MVKFIDLTNMHVQVIGFLCSLHNSPAPENTRQLHKKSFLSASGSKLENIIFRISPESLILSAVFLVLEIISMLTQYLVKFLLCIAHRQFNAHEISF